MAPTAEISVCVPTYKRPEHLIVALRSIIDQNVPALEIFIGDDSNDDLSERALAEIQLRPGVRIDYSRNVPGLGQNDNVQRLIERANTRYFLLLHDDDVLLAGALNAMLGAMQANPAIRIVFGKQEIIDFQGAVLAEETRELNKRYFRTEQWIGVQTSALASAFRQQIPNNGFLVETALARQTGYRPKHEVGVYCDIDFNIRLAARLDSNSVMLLDRFTSQYRLSRDAVSVSATASQVDHPAAGLVLYRETLAIEIDESNHALKQARSTFLERESDKAVKALALRGDRIDALKIFFSRYYPLRRRLSSKGVYHLALVVTRYVDRLRRYRR